MTPTIRLAFGVASFLCLTSSLGAQGSLGQQGFGFPGGQLSARAAGTGGALGDFDPQSPLNPAALSLSARASIYLQYDAEARSVNTASSRVSSSEVRFPLFAASGRLLRATFGLAFSSYLDRSWLNTYPDSQVLNGRRVPSSISASSKGGINDARAAVSWTFGPRLHVGAAVHVFPGENRISIARTFPDSTRLGTFTDSGTLSYGGSAFSLGVLALPVAHLNIGATIRLGRAMQARRGDSTVVGEAKLPDRYSLSLAYDGVPGTNFAVRYSSESWSRMQGLGSARLAVFDATDVGVGAETAGPAVQGIASTFRLGYRTRQLPFGVGLSRVSETSADAGASLPLASGRTVFDLAVQRAHRTAGSLSENAWIVSVGLSIKP